MSARTPEQKARNAAAQRAKYAANPELFKERNHRYYMAHREQRLADAKRYYERDPQAKNEYRRRHRLENVEMYRARDRARWSPKRALYGRLRPHGLTVADYEAMLAAQGNACGICRRPFEGIPAIDHHHASGVVRGLLCSNCNVGIGHLREDPALFRAAIAWVEKNREKAEEAA